MEPCNWPSWHISVADTTSQLSARSNFKLDPAKINLLTITHNWWLNISEEIDLPFQWKENLESSIRLWVYKMSLEKFCKITQCRGSFMDIHLEFNYILYVHAHATVVLFCVDLIWPKPSFFSWLFKISLPDTKGWNVQPASHETVIDSVGASFRFQPCQLWSLRSLR